MVFSGIGKWFGRSDEHDHLFDPVARDWRTVPAQVIGALYGLRPDAADPESLASSSPALRHFSARTAAVLAAANAARLADLTSGDLGKIRALYACCYDKHQEFSRALKAQADQSFRDELIELRTILIKEQAAHLSAREARKAYYARMQECSATGIDIRGETLVEQVSKMSPDDWHEIALNWNWENGREPLFWIISQPNCDLATATRILFQDDPCFAAQHELDPTKSSDARENISLLRQICCNIVDGFYLNDELMLGLRQRETLACKRERQKLEEIGRYPWILPDSIFCPDGKRKHIPRYTVENGEIHYHYEYWLREIAH